MKLVGFIFYAYTFFSARWASFAPFSFHGGSALNDVLPTGRQTTTAKSGSTVLAISCWAPKNLHICDVYPT